MPPETFAYSMENYGAFSPVERVTDAELDSYRGKLPASLLDLWSECGRGAWLGGLFQFCDPAAYHPLLEDVFGHDPDFDCRECLPFGFTAFGELFVWSKRHHVVKVDFRFGWFSARELNRAISDKADLALKVAAGSLARSADMLDERKEPLFARAKGKLGPLALGEMYGFFPALSLGGTVTLENLQRVSAFEHLSILAQLGDFVLEDFSSWPSRTIRPKD